MNNPEEGMFGSLSNLPYEEFHMMRVVYYSSGLKSSSSTVSTLSTRWHHKATVLQFGMQHRPTVFTVMHMDKV